MSFGLTVQIGDGAAFSVETDHLPELLEQYKKMGGSDSWLLGEVKRAVADAESLPVSVALATETRTAEPEQAVAAPASDPWADETPLPDEPSEDPWADPTPTDRGSSGAPAQSQPASADAVSTVTDKFGRQWTMGLPEAPTCDCGVPAARLRAKAKGSGKTYVVWKCAKAQGSEWRDKCEYSVFPD